MSLRSVLLVAALLAGCASGPSLEQRAQAACAEEGHLPGADMDRCIVQTEEALRRAQEQPRPQPAPPPGRR